MARKQAMASRWADMQDDDVEIDFAEIDFETYAVFYLFFNLTQNGMSFSTATELTRSFTDEMRQKLHDLIADWRRLQGVNPLGR